MKKCFYWITWDWSRDISENPKDFQIYRTVIWADDTLDNKEQRLKEIPFHSVLNSLEDILKNKMNRILDNYDLPDIGGSEGIID